MMVPSAAPTLHKRKRRKHRHVGCLLCNPSKLNTNKTTDRMRARPLRRRDWDGTASGTA